MESNHQSPVSTNSNGERASSIQGALTAEEVLSKESYGPNNQPVISYHKRYPDGEYFLAILSPGYGFSPEDDVLIVDYLNKEINKEEAPYIRIPKVNVYNHTPEELAGTYVCFICFRFPNPRCVFVNYMVSTYEDLINFFENLEVYIR